MSIKSALPKLPEVRAPRGLSFDLAQGALARWNSALSAKADDDEATISIYDPIGVDFWGEGFTVKRMSAALRSIGAERAVLVNINSPGGNVFDGISIYNLLREHKGEVTTRVIGMAASAASVVAMAGDKVQIALAGSMMLHNIWGEVVGNRNDLRDAADMLEPFDNALAELYAARSGNEVKAVAKMMDKETFLVGAQAIEQGFADELVPADQIADGADADKRALASTDLRLIDIALAKQGMPRAERRALLNRFHDGTPSAAEHDGGTPSAASLATPSAGEISGDVKGFLEVLERRRAA